MKDLLKRKRGGNLFRDDILIFLNVMFFSRVDNVMFFFYINLNDFSISLIVT